MGWLKDLLTPPPIPPSPEADDPVEDVAAEGEEFRRTVDEVLIEWHKDFDHLSAELRIKRKTPAWEDLYGRR